MLKQILLIVLFSISVSANADMNYSYVTGGWSWHWFDKTNKYNESHHVKGYEIGSDKHYVGIYKFRNSYRDKSYLAAYHYNKCDQRNRLTWCYGAFGGYVSGYEKFSVIVAPELLLSYSLSKNFSFGGTVSCLPGLCAATFKLTFK